MPEVIINGPEGRIEGRYHHCKTPNAPIALLLHPHPQHGGTMNNKVVYALYHAFVRRGFSALRFNFRGVGRSQGNFDRGARLAAELQRQYALVLDRRLLLRRLDRHAAAHAAARDRRLHRGGAAGKSL
jgi:alpha/beta superfamily hydrolase